jgi:hypothetical protein
VRRHHGSAAAVPARLPVIRRLTCQRLAGAASAVNPVMTSSPWLEHPHEACDNIELQSNTAR